MNSYGYVRVSTREQNVARQIQAMALAGIASANIFVDRESGKTFQRSQYQRLVKRLRSGDALYLKSIDRLGRDYEEIIEQWRYLTKVKHVDIIVLDFPLLDTRKHVNGVTGRLIADLVLQILSYAAQVERENIHQRQMEGIRIALEKGTRFGRPRKEKPPHFDRVLHLWRQGEISLREAARQTGVSHHTFSKWAREALEENCANWEKR